MNSLSDELSNIDNTKKIRSRRFDVNEGFNQAIRNAINTARGGSIQPLVHTQNTESTGTVSSNSDDGTNHDWMAFDRSDATKWRTTASSGQYLRYVFTTNIALSKIVIVAGDPSTDYPRDFRIKVGNGTTTVPDVEVLDIDNQNDWSIPFEHTFTKVRADVHSIEIDVDVDVGGDVELKQFQIWGFII